MRCLASSGGGVCPEAFSPPARDDVRRDLNNLHGRQNEIKRRILGTKSISRAEKNTQNLHSGWVGGWECVFLRASDKCNEGARSSQVTASERPSLSARALLCCLCIPAASINHALVEKTELLFSLCQRFIDLILLAIYESINACALHSAEKQLFQFIASGKVAH